MNYQVYYDFGADWAIAYFDKLSAFSGDWIEIKKRAIVAFDTSGILENLPSRQYSQAVRHWKRIEEEFVKGAWDTIHFQRKPPDPDSSSP